MSFPESLPSYTLPETPTMNRKAATSFKLGLASFFFSALTGVPAVIWGFLSLREIRRTDRLIVGKWLAVSGIVLGLVGSLASGFVVMYAVAKVRRSAQAVSMAGNLVNLGMAMHNYHHSHGRFPPAAVRGPDGKPLLSWRVLILPFLEQQELYNEFKLDERWDSPHNIQLLSQMPGVFGPYKGPAPADGMTYFQVFVGPGTAFEGPEGLTFKDFPDGISNTILIVEAWDAVPWTKPEDLPYSPNGPLPRLGGIVRDGNARAAFVDGSVHDLRQGIKEETMRALITRNGHEKIDDAEYQP